jgi:type IV pilus assembly protein PilE
MSNYRRGFTLIELMITVAIVGVLAAIAYPSYTQSVLRSHRTDARAALMQDAQTLEKCYTMNGNYTGCGTFPHNSDNSFYNIPAWTARTGFTTANSYVLTANARGTQTNDNHCAFMAIDDTGAKTATNADCWSR